MPEPTWVDPRTDYITTSQVTPDIFNTLGENEKYLNERKSTIEKQTGSTVVVVPTIVFVEE
jgi:hypothetical protein